MRIDPRLVVTLLGLAALGVASQGTWWTVSWSGDLGPAGSAPLTGGTGTGGLAIALPVVILAAMLATLTLRRAGRRAVGVLGLVTAAGMAVLGLSGPAPGLEVVQQAVRAATLATDLRLEPTAMAVGYGVIGVAAAAASGWLIVKPPPARTRRGRGEPTSEVTDALSSWKAMDEGRDPTQADETQAEGDVHERER
ncbi:MAG: Trp biosynthesis-associated membrane protein [Actinomycetes bacterium]